MEVNALGDVARPVEMELETVEVNKSPWEIFVGSEIGLLKGVSVSEKRFQNLNDMLGLNRESEITAMMWENVLQEKFYVGLRNQTIKIFDRNKQCFQSIIDVKSGEGPIKGLGVYNGKIVTAVESGTIKLWSEEGEDLQLEIAAGAKVHRMRQNLSIPQLIATGGEENDLKIWDLETPDQPLFKAKNVRNDFLDLRVPVWVTDMQFLPNSKKVISCTRHHHIRLYDPNSPQRRPVMAMEFEKHPLISLSLGHREHEIVVGSSRGRMALLDLRKKALVHVFKGFAGSVRYVQCHPVLPLVASCGLDRYLRVHELNTHKLLSKIYLKSRLNALLMCSNFTWNCGALEKNEDLPAQNEVAVSDEDNEKTWHNMEVIKDQVTTRKKRVGDKIETRKRQKNKLKSPIRLLRD